MGRGKGECKVEDEVKASPYLLFSFLSSHLTSSSYVGEMRSVEGSVVKE